MKTAIRRSIASLLVVSVTSLGAPSPVQAGTVSTEEAIAVKRERIAQVLDRSEVRAELEASGVSSSSAKARVEALTDREVAQLAGRIDALPAGGDPISVILMLPILAISALALVGSAIFAIGKAISRSSGKAQEKPAGDVSPFPGQG